MKIPTPRIADEDAIEDYSELTRSETIPMTRLRISDAEDSEDDDAKESDNE